MKDGGWQSSIELSWPLFIRMALKDYRLSIEFELN